MASASAEERVHPWPLSRLDVAGAFGDIGVLFPIAIALISLNHMNPTAVFLAAGLAYILAGAYFRIPMSVQPFKAVAAIALALALPPSSIATAGLLMGVLMAVLGITNLVTVLAKLFSLPIVRGVQLGLGLILVREGLRLIFGSKSEPVLAGTAAVASWEIALAGAVVLLVFLHSRRFPAALLLLAGGIVLGLLGHGRELHSLGAGPAALDFLRPSAVEVKRMFIVLALPQFALTFGNSIVATENTARVLFGARANRVTARALSLSIGVMNLLAASFLGTPMCHGSGGVTAHYKFGARGPKSTYVIGGACLLLAFSGRAAVVLLRLIPVAVLGVFLVYVGVQHGALVRDVVKNRSSILIAASVGIVSLLVTNLTLGFLVGFAVQGALTLVARLARREVLALD